MAASDAVKLKIGEQLCTWVYLGVRTGAYRFAELYEANKSTNYDEAIRCIKKAVDLPSRVKYRISKFITDNNPGATTYLNSCVQMWSNSAITLAELSADINSIETYALALRDAKLAETKTWDEISLDIRTNVENQSRKWDFPLNGYVDVWGE